MVVTTQQLLSGNLVAMDTRTPYWWRRIRWATGSTVDQLRRWSRIIDLAAIPVVGYALLKSYEYIEHGIPSSASFFGWITNVPELGVWSILYTLPSGLLVLLVHWTLNWTRAPGKMDKQLHVEFEEAIQRVKDGARNLYPQRQVEAESLREENERLHQRVEYFEERLRPAIWIKETIFTKDTVIMATADDVLTGKTTRVGFTIENRSDNDLSEVQVTLQRLQICDFINAKRIDFQRVNLPILLEWDPQEQESGGKSTTTIPAGSSRRIGLFENNYILSANTKVRRSVTIDTKVYRRTYYVILRVSATGISATDSAEYTVTYTTASAPPEGGDDTPVDIEPKGYQQLFQE